MKFTLALIFAFIVVPKLYGFTVSSVFDIEGNEVEITRIDLSNKGLMEFPKGILKCENLEELILADNGLIQLPIELSQLRHLRVLDLSGNQGLSYNDLEDVFKVAAFQLQELNISDCEMGFITYEIGRQKGLKRINISGNRLNNLPYAMIQLKQLEVLDASNNQIEDLSWQVHQWWKLKELNVANNPELKTTELVFALSVCEGLDKLVISNLNEFPRVFSGFAINELEIHDSQIANFPRTQQSTPIRKISFVNCQFTRPSQVAETISDFAQPEYIRFNQVQPTALRHFMGVKADSIDIRDNKLRDITALAGLAKLKWVDARDNYITADSKEKLATARPELELLYSEKVEASQGINAPFPQFQKSPTEKTISAAIAQEVRMGRATFDFPENAFLDQDGNVYTGAVDLAYTEYFTPAEIFLSGITMTADSANETMMFSSAGMFNIEANDAEGNELVMNPETPVGVDLLSSDPDPAMRLYQLDQNGDWEDKGRDSIVQPFKVDMALVDSAASNAFYGYLENNIIVTENRFVPNVRGDGNKKSFTISFDELITNNRYKPIETYTGALYIQKPQFTASYIAKSSFVYDGSMDSLNYYRKWFREVRKKSRKAYRKLHHDTRKRTNDYKWGINYIKDLDLAMSRNSDRMYLQFLYKDSAVSIPVVLASEPSDSRRRMNVFQRFYKTYYRYKQKDNVLLKTRGRRAEIEVQRRAMEIRNLARSMEVARQQAIYNNDTFYGVYENVSSVNRSFALSGFGIWNCDRRRRVRRPKDIPQAIVNEDGVDMADSVVSVSVIDYDNRGVFSFGKQGAFFDASSAKTAIVVFFSSTAVGIYKSWKNKMNRRGDMGESMEVETQMISTMTQKDLMQMLAE